MPLYKLEEYSYWNLQLLAILIHFPLAPCVYMANTNANTAREITRVVSFYLIFCVLFMGSIKARNINLDHHNYHDDHQVSSPRALVMRKLGFDMSKLVEEYSARRSVATDRLSPGGPDPQHHFWSPSLISYRKDDQARFDQCRWTCWTE